MTEDEQAALDALRLAVPEGRSEAGWRAAVDAYARAFLERREREAIERPWLRLDFRATYSSPSVMAAWLFDPREPMHGTTREVMLRAYRSVA